MSAAQAIERAKIWLAVKFVWPRDGKMAEAIRGFQATEADGVWHLHRALHRLDDPRQRAILFTHGLEEESHAEEFTLAYAHYGQRPLAPANFERRELYSADEPTWKPVAFVNVGEDDATERFRLLRDTIDDGLLKESLGRVVADEEGHVGLTHNLLVRMGATDDEIRSELRRVRLQRLWESWLRSGRRVIDRVATVVLSALYFFIGAALHRTARARLSRDFVDYDNNRIKKLVE
jgi:hypothetical protein